MKYLLILVCAFVALTTNAQIEFSLTDTAAASQPGRIRVGFFNGQLGIKTKTGNFTPSASGTGTAPVDSSLYATRSYVNTKTASLNTSFPLTAGSTGGTPAANKLTVQQFKDFVVDLQLSGTQSGLTYSVPVVYRNSSGWSILIYSNTGQPGTATKVAEFTTSTSPENGSAVTIHTLGTTNSSGVSGRIAVNWSKIANGQYFSMFGYSETAGNAGFVLASDVFSTTRYGYLAAYDLAQAKISASPAPKALSSLSDVPDQVGQIGNYAANGRFYRAVSLNPVVWLPMTSAGFPFTDGSTGGTAGPTRLTIQQMRDFLVDIQLSGPTSTTLTYCVPVVYRNSSGWSVLVYSQTGSPGTQTKVAEFSTQVSPEAGDAVTIHTLSTSNSSGFTGKVAVNWSKIPVGQYFAMSGYSETASGAGFVLHPEVFNPLRLGYINAYTLLQTPITASALQSLLSVSSTQPPDVTYAPKLYTTVGKEIAIYPENLIKYWPTYRGRAEIVPPSGGKVTGRSTKYTPSAAGNYNFGVCVADEQFNLLVSYATLTVVATDPTITTPVKILNLGDSYTHIGQFTIPLQSSTAATGVTFLGIRRTNGSGSNSIKCEGRGGWTMADYHTARTDLLNPFMQPADPYLYYGNTSFWIQANVASPAYDYGQYGDVKGLFNATTGYKISPAVNDVMYDNGLASYVVWNGSSWNSISTSTLNFSFNFAKYRQAWNIAQPDDLHILLGTNDNASATETTFQANWSTYKTRYDAMIASIKADSPNCKVIVGIPVPSGRQGRDGVWTTERRKRAFWLLAKNLLATYGNREAEGIYINDYHSLTDREYGFSVTDELPYTDYTGTARDSYKPDPVHLGFDGFNQMGEAYLARIQSLR